MRTQARPAAAAGPPGSRAWRVDRLRTTAAGASETHHTNSSNKLLFARTRCPSGPRASASPHPCAHAGPTPCTPVRTLTPPPPDAPVLYPRALPAALSCTVRLCPALPTACVTHVCVGGARVCTCDGMCQMGVSSESDAVACVSSPLSDRAVSSCDDSVNPVHWLEVMPLKNTGPHSLCC